jgi:hypothetical protein
VFCSSAIILVGDSVAAEDFQIRHRGLPLQDNSVYEYYLVEQLDPNDVESFALR